MSIAVIFDIYLLIKYFPKIRNDIIKTFPSIDGDIRKDIIINDEEDINIYIKNDGKDLFLHLNENKIFICNKSSFNNNALNELKTLLGNKFYSSKIKEYRSDIINYIINNYHINKPNLFNRLIRRKLVIPNSFEFGDLAINIITDLRNKDSVVVIVGISNNFIDNIISLKFKDSNMEVVKNSIVKEITNAL